MLFSASDMPTPKQEQRQQELLQELEKILGDKLTYPVFHILQQEPPTQLVCFLFLLLGGRAVGWIKAC